MLCILAIMPKLMVTSFRGEDSHLLAWENSKHSAILRLVSPPNDVWETSPEIPCWWRVTTQIWVVLLIGWINFSRGTTNQKRFLWHSHYQNFLSLLLSLCSNVPYPYNFPSSYPASLCTDSTSRQENGEGRGEGYVYRLNPVCHLS